MGPEGAVNIIYRRDIAASPTPDQRRQKLIDDYKAHFANPYVAAERGYIDDVIIPHETRPKVIIGARDAADQARARPPAQARQHPAVADDAAQAIRSRRTGSSAGAWEAGVDSIVTSSLLPSIVSHPSWLRHVGSWTTSQRICGSRTPADSARRRASRRASRGTSCGAHHASLALGQLIAKRRAHQLVDRAGDAGVLREGHPLGVGLVDVAAEHHDRRGRGAAAPRSRSRRSERSDDGTSPGRPPSARGRALAAAIRPARAPTGPRRRSTPPRSRPRSSGASARAGPAVSRRSADGHSRRAARFSATPTRRRRSSPDGRRRARGPRGCRAPPAARSRSAVRTSTGDRPRPDRRSRRSRAAAARRHPRRSRSGTGGWRRARRATGCRGAGRPSRSAAPRRSADATSVVARMSRIQDSDVFQSSWTS